MIRKKLIAGNWKMNKTAADGVSLTREILAELGYSPAEIDAVLASGGAQSAGE